MIECDGTVCYPNVGVRVNEVVMRGLRLDYRLMRCGLRALLLIGAAGTRLSAQVVRGVVRDASTQAPIPGVIVSLDEATPQPDTEGSLRRSTLVLAVLTNERGEFSVRATAAGRYEVTAKRVGLKRYQSTAFQISVGETRRVDITLDHIDFTAALPPITVTTDAPCAINRNENERVAALWEEARAALTATRLSLRDRLFRATMVRYVRDLRPNGLRVIREQQTTRHGVTERPFASLAADRLSAEGYMQIGADGSRVFYAPDAAVLTSPEFLRDHCFSIARDARVRPALIGLAFQPTRDRLHPDIRGALWMDSATFELRLVEFTYTSVPSLAAAGEARGEVQFKHLPNAGWHVSKWFIRMPEMRSLAPSPSSPFGGRDEVARYREEGGDVAVEGTAALARGAVLNGRAFDSTGRAPLRGATVRLSGTRYSAPVNADGSFRLDSIPAGAYTLALEQASYAALGLLAAEQELEIAENSTSVTAVNSLGTEQILRRLCGKSEFEDDHAAARVLVRAADGTPLSGVEVRARFETFEVDNSAATAIRVRPLTFSAPTSDDGAVVLCDLPARQPIRFELTWPGEKNAEYQVVTLPRHHITVVAFTR